MTVPRSMIRRMSIVDVDCPRTRRRGSASASAATLFFAARHRFQRVLAVFGVDLYGLDLFGVSWPLGSLVPGNIGDDVLDVLLAAKARERHRRGRLVAARVGQESAGNAGVSRSPPRRRLAAVIASLLAFPGLAAAEDVAPLASPDRIEDAPSTRADPYPTFDNFAWRAFIALNWPSLVDAAHRGAPDRARTLGDPGPRVWETFKSRYELFEVGPDGQPVEPSPWASYDGRNPCGDGFDNREKTLASFTPYAEFNQPGFTLGEFLNPLVAQNRTYTRYEIRLNEPEYDAIAAKGWSEGLNLPDEAHPADLPIGSIAVKAAWRELTDADSPAVRARYYVVRDAEIVDVGKSVAAGRIVCSKNDVALVGFHIMIKTRYRPQWLWSTFEHVDNVPPAGEGDAREPDAKDAGAPYSYCDASQPDRKLPLLGSPEFSRSA